MNISRAVLKEPPVRRKSRLDKLEIPEEDDEANIRMIPVFRMRKLMQDMCVFRKKLSQIHANTEKRMGEMSGIAWKFSDLD